MSSESDGYIGKFLKKADEAVQEGVKKADAVLAEAVEVGAISAKEAAKTGRKLSEKALKEESKMQKKAEKVLNDKLKNLKRGGSRDSMRDLELIEKLGELKDKGVITEREFQSKKKKILDQI